MNEDAIPQSLVKKVNMYSNKVVDCLRGKPGEIGCRSLYEIAFHNPLQKALRPTYNLTTNIPETTPIRLSFIGKGGDILYDDLGEFEDHAHEYLFYVKLKKVTLMIIHDLSLG
jgi:hypothetical protein